MRDKYWAMYTELKHKERYYWHYQIHVKRLNAAISAFCIIVSASSIAGWGIWSQIPLLWGVILAIAQIIQAVKPLFPFNQQISSLNFLLPTLTKCMIEIDREWDEVNLLNSEDENFSANVSQMIHNRYDEFYSLTSQYIGNTYFPLNNHCDKNAEKDCINYFSHNYNV